MTSALRGSLTLLRSSSACGRCFVSFVVECGRSLDPVSVHGLRTKHTRNIYHKQMNNGVILYIVFLRMLHHIIF